MKLCFNRHPSYFTKLLASLLIAMLVSSPGFAKKTELPSEQAQEVDSTEPANESDEIIFEPYDQTFPELDHLQKLSPDQTATYDLEPEEQEIYNRASELYSRSIEYANQLREKMGEAAFAQAVKENLIVWSDEELNGEAELSLLNGSIFARVKLNEYPKLSINFIDHKIDLSTDQAQKFVARQHVKGSDVLVFATYQDKIENIKMDRRAPFFSWKRLKDFYDSWRAKPTAGDIIYMGMINGLAQGAMVAQITVWKTGIPFEEALQRPETIFTALFGLTIGVFIKAYKNFTYAGGKLRRVMTSLSVSAAFSYIYASLVYGADNLFPGLGATNAELWTAAGLHGALLLNQFVNQVGKDDYFEIIRGAEKLREMRGDINIPGLPSLSILNALHQGIYSLISFPLKMADMAGIKREAFWGSVVAFRALNAMYFHFRYLRAKLAYERHPTEINLTKLQKISQIRETVLAKASIKQIMYSPVRWLKDFMKKREEKSKMEIRDCSGAFQKFEVQNLKMAFD